VIALSLAEVAAVVGGVTADAPGDGPDKGAAVLVTGPAFLDSRRPEAGGLFVGWPASTWTATTSLPALSAAVQPR